MINLNWLLPARTAERSVEVSFDDILIVARSHWACGWGTRWSCCCGWHSEPRSFDCRIAFGVAKFWPWLCGWYPTAIDPRGLSFTVTLRRGWKESFIDGRKSPRNLWREHQLLKTQCIQSESIMYARFAVENGQHWWFFTCVWQFSWRRCPRFWALSSIQQLQNPNSSVTCYW